MSGMETMEFIEMEPNKAKEKERIDTVIMDPARDGSDEKFLSSLVKMNPKQVVYISCNPKTLKRDIDKLTNYDLKDISACSMFPRTKHIECVCLLERK